MYTNTPRISITIRHACMQNHKSKWLVTNKTSIIIIVHMIGINCMLERLLVSLFTQNNYDSTNGAAICIPWESKMKRKQRLQLENNNPTKWG